LSGPTQICVIPFTTEQEKAGFSGYLVDTTTHSCYGLMGVEIDRPNPLDCCCQADDPPLWFKMTIIDFKGKREVTHIVEKKGGDYVILSSPQISFVTNDLKTDDLAKQHIQKYLNPKLAHPNAHVCIGTMTINKLDFTQDNVDTKLLCSHHMHEVQGIK